MSTETELDIKDTILVAIKTLLEKDKDLCNFSRYIDYGRFNNDYIWTTKGCEINDHNFINQTQAIRFVDDIDSRFFYILANHHSNINYDMRVDSGSCDPLFVTFRSRIYSHNHKVTKSALISDIQSIMVNLDCNYKITGSALTALDFLDKNPRMTGNERDTYKNICLNVCRLIFVGDKCHLISIIDKQHNIYVSLKRLINIYKNDKTTDKSEFYSIVFKMFKLFERCCIYFLKCGLPQYYKGLIISNVINQIPYGELTTDEKISLHTLDRLCFDDNENTDKLIKDKLDKKIEDVILKIINSNYYISNINISDIISSIKQNMKNANAHLVQKAYNNGLKLNKIFTDMGWKVIDSSKRHPYKTNYVTIRDNHIYIYKDVNIIPKIAYLNINGVGSYRILKKFVYEENYYLDQDNRRSSTWVYPYVIHTLYLDITDGVLYCDGRHPNVSNGSVCMGDLKGKVTFSKCDENEIKELLQNCEDLLKCINYTSAYNSQYDFLFRMNVNSRDYQGVETDENEIEDNNEVKTKDLEFINNTSNDIVEEIEENREENSTANTNSNIPQPPHVEVVALDTNVESEDFEEI